MAEFDLKAGEGYLYSIDEIVNKLDTIVAYLYMIKERIDEFLQERDDALSPVPILETDLIHFMETDD